MATHRWHWRLALQLGRAWVPLAVVLLAWRALGPHAYSLDLDPGAMRQEQGKLHAIRLKPPADVAERVRRLLLDVEGDRPDRAESTLRLWENGVLLGPPHAEHAAISAAGAGAYSHWFDSLFFSASDGSDPRTNGRRYQVAWVAAPRPVVTVALWLAAAITAAWGVRCSAGILRGLPLPAGRRRRAAIAVAGSAAAVSAWWWLAPSAAAVLAWWLPPLGVALLLAGGAVTGAARVVAKLSERATRVPGRAGARPRRHLLRRADAAARAAVGAWLAPACILVAVSTLVAARGGVLPRLPWSGFSLLADVQLSDAASYAGGAERLLQGAPLPELGGRRPLLVGGQAALLALGGSRSGMLLGQAVVLALALASAGTLLMRHFGPWVGAGVGLCTLSWLQGGLGSTASETLGAALGAVALAVWMRALTGRGTAWAAAGTALLAAAELLRPGSMVVLPLLMGASVVVAGRGRRLRTAAALVAVIVVLAALPWIVRTATGTTHGRVNGNLANTLLGHATGTDWQKADEFFTAELAAQPDVVSRVDFRYRKAWELIRSQPSVFVGSLWRGLTEGLRFAPESALRDSRLTTLDAWPLPRDPGRLGLAWGVAALASVVVASYTGRGRRRGADDPGGMHPGTVLGLWLLGVILSLPVIWTDGSFRALAADYPAFALAFMLPAWWGRRSLTGAAAPLPALPAAGAAGVAALLPAGVLLAVVAWIAAGAGSAGGRPARDASPPGERDDFSVTLWRKGLHSPLVWIAGSDAPRTPPAFDPLLALRRANADLAATDAATFLATAPESYAGLAPLLSGPRGAVVMAVSHAETQRHVLVIGDPGLADLPPGLYRLEGTPPPGRGPNDDPWLHAVRCTRVGP